jgi:dipeptide/tripeptide permease
VGLLKLIFQQWWEDLQGDIRRDKGFSIFYIGINTGSLLATMVIGFVVVKWDMQVLV